MTFFICVGDDSSPLGQIGLIEYNKGNIYLQKSCRKWGRETISRPLFVFLKSFIWGKNKFQYISIALNLACNKNRLYKTLNYWSRDMSNFDFLGRVIGIVSLPHFVYDFSRKMFLMLYSFDWPNFIVWLPLLLEILGNTCITIVCFLGCDIINFKINLISLIKPFFYMTKKSKQKFLRTKKAFKVT